MEQLNDLQTMLDQLECPAFLVKDGQVCAVNPGAKQRMAEPGMAVRNLLVTGHEEYEAYTGGDLYVTLTLGGTIYRCTVTKLQEQELFSIETRSASYQLQALALAAAQLRIPISELSLELNRLESSNSELLSMMNQSLHRLQRIIGNMSDAAEYAEGVPQKSMQEMSGLFGEILEKAKTLLSHSGVQMHVRLPTEPVYTLADRDMLERAVYNLLSNACKFANTQNPIDVTLKRVQNKLYLTVCDNGQGVDVSQRSTMFTRYKRQPGIEDPRHGIGLGMTLIHSAAAAHGGTVLVEYPEGKGTRVTMSLSIDKGNSTDVRTTILKPDVYGGQDSALIELSDVLPHELYKTK